MFHTAYNIVLLWHGWVNLTGLKLNPKTLSWLFLQCFDTVGWVIWPVKPVLDMTYVFEGKLNLTQLQLRRHSAKMHAPSQPGHDLDIRPWKPFQQCPLAHMKNICVFVERCIRMPPPSREILHHAKQVLPDDILENIIPLPRRFFGFNGFLMAIPCFALHAVTR